MIKHNRHKRKFYDFVYSKIKKINNQETFEKMLEIHNLNHKNFDLEFSFVGTGVARITKLSTKKLVMSKKIPTRKYSLLNFMRNIYLNLFKRNA
jgi:hypothetical protein